MAVEWKGDCLDGAVAVCARYMQQRQSIWEANPGLRVRCEPLSGAFCREARVRYDGPDGEPYPNDSVKVDLKWTPNTPATYLLKKFQKHLAEDRYTGLTLKDIARSGGVVGDAANKQPKYWTQRGFLEAYVSKVLPIYEVDSGWHECMERALQIEHDAFVSAVVNLQGQGDLILQGKSPDSGTGYPAWPTRAAMAKALDRGEAQDPLLEDAEVYYDGQCQIWDAYPRKAGWIVGLKHFSGSVRVVRSDVDVETFEWVPGGAVRSVLRCTNRGANETPFSVGSAPGLTSKAEMHQRLDAVRPPHYVNRMDIQNVASTALCPPFTSEWAQNYDEVGIDTDIGLEIPAPEFEQTGRTWRVTMRKPVVKSGADSTIGLGLATVGSKGTLIPEYSSGRPMTSYGYEALIDTNVDFWLTKGNVRFVGMSNGDDQYWRVKYDDVPTCFDNPMAPMFKVKGSRGNLAFRWGRYCWWIGPNNMVMAVVPRGLHTKPSAGMNLFFETVKQSNILHVNDNVELQLPSATTTAVGEAWKKAPDVFWMEGEPKDVAERIMSREYQQTLAELVGEGLLSEFDAHAANAVMNWEA